MEGFLLSKEGEKTLEAFKKGLNSLLDILAPSAIAITPFYLQLGDTFCQTLYVYTYPRYLQTNWLFPIINSDVNCDISLFIYPQSTPKVMEMLKKQVGRLESTRHIEEEKGLARDPELETAIQDVEDLRDVLQKGELRLFQFGLYITIYSSSLEELKVVVKEFESLLAGQLVYTKTALFRSEQGFNSTLPIFADELTVMRNLDTGSLSTAIPFVSSTLTANSGVLYGLNRHNNTLILFDRFELENANMCVFAKSGAGKSYAVKLEILRTLMFGTDVIVIDPENEYKPLVTAIGGFYLSLSLNSPERINPFDLPVVYDQSETGEEILRSAVVTLHGLLKLMLGELTPEEDALLDKALFETYALKDITADPATHKNPPPTLSDLTNVLANMPGATSILSRLQKYTEGTFAGFLNKPTNILLKPGFTVFSIRDLEEELRPIAMYLVLTYIWNAIRFNPKRRILVIDEAWWMMQYEDTARFLYGLAKRARKYHLGLTVISQDVEDFLTSRFGKAVVSNSSLQLLLKQSTASIEVVTETFNLTEGEKYLLLESDVGEGLLFAGSNHVAIRVISSFTEDRIINGDLSFLSNF
jgi:type IV secretory pathway VirB4 component